MGWDKDMPLITRNLVYWVGSYKTIRNTQLLLMRLKVGEGYITYDVVILIGCVLLAYLGKVEQVALFSRLITEVDTEGMLGCVLR